MAASADFNVLQHSSSVLVSDRGNASLGRVKVADVTLEPPQQLPGSAVPAFGEKTVAVADPGSGRLWVTQSSKLGSIDFDAQEPAVSNAQGIAATVGVDDVVHAVDPVRGEVTSLRVNATGGVDSRNTVQYEQIRNKENVQIAAVGDKQFSSTPKAEHFTFPAAGWQSCRMQRTLSCSRAAPPRTLSPSPPKKP